MSTGKPKHLIVYTTPLWGHTRTMCTLVARIVTLDKDITVTYFTSDSIYNQVKAEIARDFISHHDAALRRIRLIGLDSQGGDVSDFNGINRSFQDAWTKTMLSKEPLVCAKTGELYAAHPTGSPPDAVLLDIFLINGFDTIKNLTPNMKVYNWYPASVLSSRYILYEDFRSQALEEASRTGVPFEEVAHKIITQATGRVIRSPCTPPMYDYEYHPQEFPLPPEIARDILVHIAGRVKESDGVVTFDAADFAPEGTRMLQVELAQTSRKAYFAGPLMPEAQEEGSDDPRAAEILKFLDEKLATHGEHSVIYVSFGSIFWPVDSTKLWAVLEAFVEKDIPIVVSGASGFSVQFHAEIQQRLAQYGNAIMAKWVPQQAVLNHAATGWYLTHGGHNSVLEAAVAGVPMIVWPIDADQPVNAIYLSETLDVAYELVEVRNGTGAGTIYRSGRTPIATVDAVKAEVRDVLSHAFGEDGKQKRAKLQALQKTLKGAWQEGGVGRREVEAFINDI